MSNPKSYWAKAGLLVACLVFTASIPGCDSNPNLAEYNEHTPPGLPPDVPNEICRATAFPHTENSNTGPGKRGQVETGSEPAKV